MTLTATYAPAPGAPARPDSTYTWTLSVAHDGAAPAPGGAPSYNLTTRVDGDASLGLQVPTTGGFDEPVIGFFALGPTLFFQLAGGVTPAGTIDTSAPYHIGVEVDTATSTIDIVTVPTNRDLDPVTVAGDFPAVPEPATLVLTGLGGGLLLLVPRLRRRLRRERLSPRRSPGRAPGGHRWHLPPVLAGPGADRSQFLALGRRVMDRRRS